MKRKKRALFAIATLGVTALGLLLTGQHYGAVAAAGCNDSTIAGTYAFALDGLVSDSFNGQPQHLGDFVPLAAVGTFMFDGKGTASRSYTASFGGAVFPNSDSGPYTVNSDCTASGTFSDGTWSMVIVGRGREIKAMNATSGVVVQGILSRQ